MKSKKPSIVIGIIIAVTTCPAYAQTCDPSIPRTAPDQRYIIYNNGTVKDIKTGLIWMRCLLGQSWNGRSCEPVKDWFVMNSREEIDKKLKYNINFAGFDDWRLPNIFELDSLVEKACIQPALNIRAFSNASSWPVWTSSQYGKNPDYAWTINFKNGKESSDLISTPSYHVRLVRGQPNKSPANKAN